MYRTNMIPVLVLVYIISCIAAPAQGAAGFLPTLALEPLLSTPTELLTPSNVSNPTVDISGRTTLTVVFSRPVIALGSDFGAAALPANATPFTLGCSVPGRGRWVTTSIYRFDPAIDWPTDLACPLVWNSALRSFDGAPVSLGAYARSVALKTEPVKFAVINVASAAADAATDKQWNAYRGMRDDNFPEVPPDANVTLSFTYPVVPSLLASALKLKSCCKRDDAAGRAVRVLPCGPAYGAPEPLFGAANGGGATPAPAADRNTTCVVINVVPGLQAGEVVELVLPAGAKYSPVAGAARAPASAYLWGLRRFRVPLRDNFQQLSGPNDTFGYADNGVSYRRATMWLPHGLAEGTRVSDLAAVISLCRYADPYKWATPCKGVDFTLERVNKGKLVMRVPAFAPREHYKIAVRAAPAIKDAFGLPLEASEAFFFTTDPTPGLEIPQPAGGGPLLLLEPAPGNASLILPVASRGQPKWGTDASGVVAWAVPAASYAPAVEAATTYEDAAAPQTKLGAPRARVARNTDALPRIQTLELPGGPGMALVGSTLKAAARIGGGAFVAQTHLQFAAATVGRRALFWVTDARGSPPPAVAGATVTLYLTAYGKSAFKGPSCTTDAAGTCAVDLTSLLRGRFGSLSALVEAPGHGPLPVGNVDTPYVPSEGEGAGGAGYSGTLVLDRSLFRPGETLRVTGYLQQRAGELGLRLPPANLTSARLQISPNWNASGDGPVSLPVAVDPVYGSIHANVSVPATAQLASYEVSLSLGGGGSGSSSSSESITAEGFQVADPRPPTAVLNLTAPTWALPNSTVRARVRITSYLGADVGGANVKLSWTVPLASGSLNVTTDAKGRAAAAIPLSALPKANATKLGDVLEVKAAWVGPTGEPYLERATIRVAEGPVRASLQRSPFTDAPGVPFIVGAVTQLEDEDETRIEGVTVDVGLVPAYPGALANCSATARAALTRQRCRVVSGEAPVPAGGSGSACTITLPCAADLLIRACTVSFRNGTKIRGGLAGGRVPCSESPIGRNTTAWLASPLALQPKLLLVPDRQNHTLGSTVVLSFATPAYAGRTSGIVVWGNGAQSRQKALEDLAPGPGRVEIGPLGAECRGGCKAAVILAAGRRAAPPPGVALPDVPTSKLFDALGPYTMSGQVTINIVGDGRLDVAVSVAGQAGAGRKAAGADDAAVVAPLSDANITVDVRAAGDGGAPAAGAQVTVVVVDRAILDLMPYALKDLAAAVQPSTDIYMSLKDVNGARATRGAINATFATLARRLKEDPWLPLDATVTPSRSFAPGEWGSISYYPTTSPVDIPDALYEARFSTPVTVTPFYTWGTTQRYPASAKAAGDASAALRVSSEFETTPLFAVGIAGADGKVTLPFRAPPNLGAFAVRAFAVSKGVAGQPSSYGDNETEVIVRLPVSLTPALPRIVRVGDEFDAGVLVTAPAAAGVSGEQSFTVTATVVAPSETNGTLGDSSALSTASSRALLQAAPAARAIRLADDASRTVKLGGGREQAEVRFRFSAAELGAAGLRFDIYPSGAARAGGGGGGALDSASFDVPVLGRQAPVTIATSFALAPNGSASGGAAVEGLALPAAEPGGGTVGLLAGVGYLPYLEATYSSIIDRLTADPPPPAYAPDAVAAAVLPSLISRYYPAGAGKSPALTPKALNASRAAAAAAAGALTDPSLGLVYSDYKNEPYSWRPSAAAVDLNAWAIWLLDVASGSDKGSTSDSGGDAAGDAALATLRGAAPTWREALARQVTKDAADARRRTPWRDAYGTPPQKGAAAPAAAPRYDDWDDLSWARLALGADWSPSPSNVTDGTVTAAMVTDDLATTRLAAAARLPGNTTSVGAAARTGLALLGSRAPGAAAAAAAIARSLLTLARVQGRTAYLAASRGSASPAPPTDQAFALALLARVAPASGAPGLVVQKLAAGAARGAGGSAPAAAPALACSQGSQAAAAAAAALAEYDDSRGSARPDATVTVAAASSNASRGGAKGAADAVLLSAAFNATSSVRSAATTTKWSALPSGADRLAFDAAGRGEVSVVASLDFTPAQLLPFPSYRGLWVERAITSETGGGAALAAAAAGTVVTVSVQITSADAVGAVNVDVLMPGGLEPIDPAVYKDPAAALACDLGGDGGGSGGGGGSYSRWWWWCPATTVTPAAVRMRYGALGPGTVSASFKAVAATPGSFALPPVRAYAVEQPELMGLSAAGSFVVCPAAAAAPAAGGGDGDGGAAAVVVGPASPLPAEAAALCGGGGAKRQRAPAAAPRACPKDCSGNGVCNLAAGACLCNAGFGGVDCSKLLTS